MIVYQHTEHLKYCKLHFNPLPQHLLKHFYKIILKQLIYWQVELLIILKQLIYWQVKFFLILI